MKILIIEDEILIAEGVALTLQTAGHQVTGIADDLASAVSLAQEQAPDLAFVDMKLANGSNGLEVARALGTMGITCVFATGNPPNREQARGLALGYIVKPFAPRLLVQTVTFVSRLHATEDGAVDSAPNGFVGL